MNDLTLRLNTPLVSESDAILDKVNRFLVAESEAVKNRTHTLKVSRLQRYVEWCDIRNKIPFPASGIQVRDFARNLFDVKNLQYKTVANYVEAICMVHTMIGLPNPRHDEYHLTLELKRMINTRPSVPVQSKALVWKDLISICKKIDKEDCSDYKKVRDKLILTLAYDTMLRRSELVELKYSDFCVGEDGDYFVRVNGLHLKGKNGSHEEYRPVSPDAYAFLMEAIAMAGTASGGYILRRLNKQSIMGKMTDQGVYLTMKKWGYSGHSARVGAAVDQRNAGISLEDISKSGGWKDLRMPMQYSKTSDIRFSGSSKYMKMRKSLNE